MALSANKAIPVIQDIVLHGYLCLPIVSLNLVGV
jgi:hypothetical protein